MLQHSIASYRFNKPKYLSLDDKGWSHVADENTQEIQIFNSERTLVRHIGTGNTGDRPHQLDSPEGVVAHSGHAWLAGIHNHHTAYYRLERW